MTELERRRDARLKDRVRALLGTSTGRTVIATLVIQATLVFTGIVSARVLGPTDRGWLALLVAVGIMCSGIAMLGLPTAVAYSLAKFPNSIRQTFISLEKALFFQCAAFGCAATVASLFLFRDSEIAVEAWACLAVLTAGTSWLGHYLVATLQGSQHFGPMNLVRVLPTTIYAIAVLAVMVGLVPTTLAVFAISWALGGFVFMSIAAILIARRFAKDDEPAGMDSKAMQRYGLVGFLGIRAPLENMNVDQLLVGAIGGPLVLGIYVIGNAFTNLPRFLAESVGLVAFPRIAEDRHSDPRRYAMQSLKLAAVFSGVSALAIGLSAQWIVPFAFGSEFEPAIAVTRVLVAAAFLLSIRRVLGDVLRGFGRPGPSTVAEIVAIAVFCSVVYPLTIDHGSLGGAVAYLIASASSLLVVGVFAVPILNRHRLDGVG